MAANQISKKVKTCCCFFPYWGRIKSINTSYKLFDSTNANRDAALKDLENMMWKFRNFSLFRVVDKFNKLYIFAIPVWKRLC